MILTGPWDATLGMLGVSPDVVDRWHIFALL